MSIRWSIDSYKTISSTQDELKKKLEKNSNLAEGFAISAEDQTNGYGRHGRPWQSDKGNLYLSFLLRPMKDPVISSQLALVTGLALTKSIQNSINNSVNITLKWPNDVFIDGQKCAGILIEAIYLNSNQYPALIIGVGVNIKNSPFDNSTFLNAHTENNIAIDVFRDQFLDIFSNNYSEWKKQGFQSFKDKFIKQTYEKDTPIGVTIGSQKITGLFKDIDNNGNLEMLCDTTRKMRKITSGDVFLL